MKRICFPIIYYPYSPVKFLILGLLNDDDDARPQGNTAPGPGQGAGPGPRLNGRGQGAGPGPNINKISSILSNMGGYWSQKWSTKVKKHIFPGMTQNGLEMVPIASGGLGNLFL